MPDDLSATLAGIRDDNIDSYADGSTSDLPRLLAALENVLEMHIPSSTIDGTETCSRCTWDARRPVPAGECELRVAITAELNGKEAGDA